MRQLVPKAKRLNQINHDAEKYLRRKIELEIARRKAAGENAPEGGSQW